MCKDIKVLLLVFHIIFIYNNTDNILREITA